MRAGASALGPRPEENPYEPGVESTRVHGTAVPVWASVEHRRVSGDDEKRTPTEFDPSFDAVRAEVTRYEHHRQIIDPRIAANVA